MLIFLLLKGMKTIIIPENINYTNLSGLSNEVKLNLTKLGQKH